MKVVILTGGIGSRLWPLSTKDCPKPFLCIQEEVSLIEQTTKRALLLCDPSDLIFVTDETYVSFVEMHVHKMCTRATILTEPMGKNTAPAVVLALCFLQEIGYEEDVLFMPVDSFIEKEAAFAQSMRNASMRKNKDKLLLFGHVPHKIDEGLGYLVLGKQEGNYFVLEKFIEKPCKEEIEALSSTHRVVWNMGHLLGNVTTLQKSLSRHHAWCREALLLRYTEAQRCFETFPEISLDHALLEKNEDLEVCLLTGVWCDLGSFDNIYDVLEKDVYGNICRGSVHTEHVQNSMLWSNDLPIVAHHIDHLSVVVTKEVIYVGKRGYSQEVRKLSQECALSRKVLRPWGFYVVLEESSHRKIKKIVVKPYARLSLQMHRYRKEHWTVLQGTAFVEREDENFFLNQEDSISIPIQAKHRLSNVTDHWLEVLEVQSGSVVWEDDIIRLEDDYTRALCSENA